MVSSEVPFPDVEAGVITWLSESIDDLVSNDEGFQFKHVGDEFPSNYVKRMPFVTVSVDGGPTDGVTWFAEVGMSAYAQSRAQAREILAKAFATMGVYPRSFGGVVADRVEVSSWPHRTQEHEPDSSTVCFSGELTISVRRQKGS